VTWHVVSLAVAGGTLLVLLRWFARLPDLPTRFVILAIWGRYTLAAFHEFTYPPIVAGLSLNALFSIFVALVGAALVPPRFYLQPRLLPLVVLGFVVGLSGLINTEFGGLLTDATKWVYFVVVALLLYRACRLHDPDLVLRGVFIAALTPLILQFLSVVFGQVTRGADGTVNYIGGYFHEGAFSIVLFTILCLGALIRWRLAVIALLLVPLCLAGIVLANYRTTMVATLPLVMMLVGGTLLRWTPPALRPLSGSYILAGAAALLALIVAFMPARFLDILVVLESSAELVKPAADFSAEERELFSGRIFIWAQYLSSWWAGSPLQQALGFGPEAWEGRFPVYAHNTFVSYLYEFGIVGLFALLGFFATQIAVAARAAPPFLATKLVAAMVSYLALNLATMPLWQIEGLILLAILCATSWAGADDVRVSVPAESFDGPSARPEKRPIGARWRPDPTTPLAHRRTSGTAPPRLGDSWQDRTRMSQCSIPSRTEG